MAFGLDVAGIGVVGDLVALEGENPVIDFYVTLQLVNFAVFFLMHGADADWFGTLCGGGW